MHEHPSALPAAGAATAMGAAGIRSTGGSAAQISLLLPTAAGAPCPSPDLLYELSASATKAPTVLAPWTIPTLAIEPAEAMRLLLGEANFVHDPSGIPDQSVPARGRSLHFLSEVALVALDLVARGRILPGLWQDLGGDPEPRWLAVPGAPDLDRLRALAASLPTVLRVASVGPTAPTGEAAVVVLERILGCLVDALVRRASPAVGPMFGPSPRRRTSPTETWLAGLAKPIPMQYPSLPRP